MTTSGLEMRLRVPLDRFSLDVDCSTNERVVGLFGPSGSGKTTWLESVAGLRRQAVGKVRCGDAVWLDSERGINLAPERRGIGYVPQDQRLFPHLDVRKNLLFATKRARAESRWVESTFREVVDVLELEPLLEHRTQDLSGGERQRVALGRALCSGPRLLMLDEPLASLDIEFRYRILPFLKRVRDHFDIPMLIVSHQPLELQALCDEVISLRKGNIAAKGNPTDVFTRRNDLDPESGDGFENLLTAVHQGRDGDVSRVRLGIAGEPVVSCRPIGSAPGTPVTITIPAHDLILANHHVEGISARNIFPATVSEIRPAPSGDFVFVKFGDGPHDVLVAELTRAAVIELNLEKGRNVFVIVKANSIRCCSGNGSERSDS